MGILIDYYAGDAETITRLFISNEHSIWDDPAVEASCDFSIHIDPDWLDVLHDLLATGDCFRMYERALASEYRLLAEGDTYRVEQIPNQVVLSGAAIDPNDAESLAKKWIETLYKLDADGLDNLEVTPDMILSLREFLNVCRVGAQKAIPVVRTWCL